MSSLFPASTRTESLASSGRATFVPRVGLIVLGLALASCGSPATASRQAAQNPFVHLPADQGAHARIQNEWWYVVGHLRSGSRTFGYELTIFRLHNVRPPGYSTPLSLFRTDIAITDEADKRFYHQVREYFPNAAAISTKTLRISVGGASLQGPGPEDMRLRARMPAGSIALTLQTKRPPMLVGGRGYLPFGDSYTYYYSLTDLATRGFLTIHGRQLQVAGTSWMDHQWGNWTWRSIRGWTWMALQLGNGVQLSVADFRSTRGRVRQVNALLFGNHLLVTSRLQITAQGSWRSPHTGATYPSGWVVRIPTLRAVLRVTPSVRDQEMTVPNDVTASYWEGSGRVAGTFQGKRVSGLSYTELTGFVP